MTRYFAQNTPRAGLEHMMMSVPGFQKRGGGMMILSRFCYKPEDVDCRYCLHYRRRSCQVRTCPYIAERLKSGAIEYLDLILEYFGHIPHAGLHKRIQAVEHWSGPDQAVLHTVSVHLRSRFADRVWDDAPPGYLAALYLLASKERLWQPALPALSHDSIDFSRIVSKPHGFAIQDYPIFYSARRLYDLKSPMEAEDLAHPKLVSDLDFHNIIYATMIARYFYGSAPAEDELMNAVFSVENTVDALKTAANQHEFLYTEKIRLWNELHMALVGCPGTEPISHEPLSQAIVGVDFVDDGQVAYTLLEDLDDIVSALNEVDEDAFLDKYLQQNGVENRDAALAEFRTLRDFYNKCQDFHGDDDYILVVGIYRD